MAGQLKSLRYPARRTLWAAPTAGLLATRGPFLFAQETKTTIVVRDAALVESTNDNLPAWQFRSEGTIRQREYLIGPNP